MKINSFFDKHFSIIFILTLIVSIVIGTYVAIRETKKQQTTINVNKIEYIISSGEQRIIILSGGLSMRTWKAEDFQSLEKYPRIKINNDKIEKAYLRIIVDFNQTYQEKYRRKIYNLKSDGSPAPGFVYAFRFFVGNLLQGGYHDTTRIYTNTLRNDPDNGLFGASQGIEILGGKEYIIDLGNAFIARDNNEIGFRTINILEYIKKNVGKELAIGGWLSDRYGTEIKLIEIIYTGEENAIAIK